MDRRTVGNVEIIALVDSVNTYPATAVYPGAGDLSQFAAYMDANGGIALGFASFVVRDGDTTVLVDTGWGPETGGRLLDEMSEAGVAPGDIDVVTFTHLHGDHTGWNFDRASGKPLFPRAKYLVPKGDWDHYGAQTPPPDSFARDIAPLKATGQLDLIEGEHRLSQSLVTLPTPGHTPGHTSVMIDAAGAQACILGDVVITMIDAAMPSLVTVFDSDQPLGVATRTATIARLAAADALVAASHLPAPGFGRFVVEDGASRWVAG